MKPYHCLLLFVFILSACSSGDDTADAPTPSDEILLTESLVELGVSYGPEDRQFLDIYKASSNCPTPIYFDAHPNGGTTAVPDSLVEDLNAQGITVIAWESFTSLDGSNLISGWEDAELMFEWVMENATTYNLDTTNLLIGGSSRGSIISWIYGHTPNPNIKGLYMYNALPDSVWGLDFWSPTENITAASPPIYFVYNREPGSGNDPVNPDFHDPNNGIRIVAEYEAYGIGNRATLVHSIGETNNTDRYQFLLDFALSVLDTCP